MIKSPDNDKPASKELQLAIKTLQTAFRRLLKRARKRRDGTLQDLNKCLEWNALHHEALLLQANLFQIKKGMREIIVEDWDGGQKRKITLNPQFEPHIEVTKRFKQSKKLRAGVPYRKILLEKVEQEIKRYESCLAELETIDSLEALVPLQQYLPKLKTPKSINAAPEALPFREFFSSSGLLLWVGKSAKDNEALTFRHAKGSDWWLHAHEFPGSHIVLRVKKDQSPDPDALQDALQLALHYSKAKNQGSAEICVTQCKYVARFGRGKIGKVHISKHQVVFVKNDPERLQNLKDRKRERT